MQSIALYQFPAVRWQQQDRMRMLWNPIHRKTFKNRPEERVRLRIIEYLLEAGWSKHRISTEESVKNYDDRDLRTDIICYSQDFKPYILIECKAEQVPLSSNTARQIARYNQNIGAPYILMSNAREDLWYRSDIEAQTIDALGAPPDFLKAPDTAGRDFAYWNERGFAGHKAVPALRSWLKPILLTFGNQDFPPLQYLRFSHSPTDIDISHYYRVIKASGSKIAYSLLASPFGGTRLMAVLNKEGENRALAELNLDLLFEGESPNTSVYSAGGIDTIDFSRHYPEDLENPGGADIPRLSESLQKLFSKY